MKIVLYKSTVNVGNCVHTIVCSEKFVKYGISFQSVLCQKFQIQLCDKPVERQTRYFIQMNKDSTPLTVTHNLTCMNSIHHLTYLISLYDLTFPTLISDPTQTRLLIQLNQNFFPFTVTHNLTCLTLMHDLTYLISISNLSQSTLIYNSTHCL